MSFGTKPAGALPTQAAQFVLLGRPVPQGSKRHVGNGVMVEMAGTRLKAYRKNLVAMARSTLATTELAGAVCVGLEFQFQRPMAHHVAGRRDRPLRADAPGKWAFPCQRGDLDKLARAVHDALTTAGVWGDDRQLCMASQVAVWASPDSAAARAGGATGVTVTPLG